MDIANIIDHTKLGPNVTNEVVVQAVKDAVKYGFASFCTYPCFISVAKQENAKLHLASVVDFPHGMSTTESRIKEIEFSVKEGADEIDIVINISLLKNDIGGFRTDLDLIMERMDEIGSLSLKVILETTYLTTEEIKKATEIIVELANVYSLLHVFVKTSTGFALCENSPVVEKRSDKFKGARVEDIKLIYSITKGTNVGIKPSGGISTKEDVEKFVSVIGYDNVRIGTSSGVKIISE